jgi:hypothetical protein
MTPAKMQAGMIKSDELLTGFLELEADAGVIVDLR